MTPTTTETVRTSDRAGVPSLADDAVPSYGPAPGTPHDAEARRRAPRTAQQLSGLTPEQMDALAAELDAIRDAVFADRGQRDADYIRRVVRAQRVLEVGGRALLQVAFLPPALVGGAAALGVSKILENMEIGHNVMHGQWDWMRDPSLHSTSWEWDNACPADQWKHSHNYLHHTYTNVLDFDKDIGYSLIRVDDSQEWKPRHLVQPVTNLVLALLFEFGVALHDLDTDAVRRGELPREELLARARGVWEKVRRQAVKDYVVFPLLAGPGAPFTLAGTVAAGVIRNVWSNVIIFCGHFPDGAEVFTEEQLDGESRGEWYVRQMLGSANISGGRWLDLASGNLSHQVEHHLWPDLCSNRLAEVAPQVEEICRRYGIPYTTGSLPRQYGQVLRSVVRHAPPPREVVAAAADRVPGARTALRAAARVPLAGRLARRVDEPRAVGTGADAQVLRLPERRAAAVAA